MKKNMKKMLAALLSLLTIFSTQLSSVSFAQETKVVQEGDTEIIYINNDFVSVNSSNAHLMSLSNAKENEFIVNYDEFVKAEDGTILFGEQQEQIVTNSKTWAVVVVYVATYVRKSGSGFSMDTTLSSSKPLSHKFYSMDAVSYTHLTLPTN